MYVHERWHELHRPPFRRTLLHIARFIASNYGTVFERPEGRPDVPDHEDSADSEAGKAFDGTPVSRLYPSDQLQGLFYSTINVMPKV